VNRPDPLSPFYSDNEEPEPRRCVCGYAYEPEDVQCEYVPAESPRIETDPLTGEVYEDGGYPAADHLTFMCPACGRIDFEARPATDAEGRS
jgi:hypothetical protein